MTFSERKAWLDRYRQRGWIEREAWNRVEELTYLKAVSYDNIVVRSSGHRRDLSDDVVLLEARKRELYQVWYDSLLVYSEISDAIEEKVAGLRNQSFLRLRYLMCMTYSEIAEHFGICDKTVYKCIRSAIAAMDTDSILILENSTDEKDSKKQG